MNKCAGQTMVEYLVVVSALVSTMFWGANATCPNPSGDLQYTNCIQNLLTTMHNKYEGYSNSMTAVHRYGEPKGDVFVSQWVEPSSDSSGSGSGSGSGGNFIPVPAGLVPLIRSSLLVSGDGAQTYGTLLGDSVLDANGQLVGTYDPNTGELLSTSGDVVPVSTLNVIVDSEGNIAPLKAVVNGDGAVLGFGYQNESTGNFHNSLTLGVTSIDGFRTVDTFSVVDVDGNLTNGAIVGNKYYKSTVTASVDGNTVVTPQGEVINFLGEPLDCAVLIDSTSFGPMPPLQSVDDFSDSSLRQWYDGISPQAPDGNPRANRKGSLDPSQNVPCPADSRQVPAKSIFDFVNN